MKYTAAFRTLEAAEKNRDYMMFRGCVCGEIRKTAEGYYFDVDEPPARTRRYETKK